ncbi:RraA family protein [Brenneria izadpanahii]|uniref:Putative 4-hydroxy-4-methyl-2-oxoglutarate aldolase n=1 Tax=Brenneria izadpanahii TaxID=2722756 RepID=A0ABX7UY76_9GAMM|nr:RraA family protein [Brenneria izadpanahii]QTF09781.1 RraA family protein [Brenneria izadpanahii]
MNLPGSEINPAPEPASQQVRDAFIHVVTPHISDSLSRSIGINGLTRYNQSGKLIGSALTVRSRGGDNLIVYQAMTMLKPGHVLVIDAEGNMNNAVIGELIKLESVRRGCVGFIVDGAIRDIASFADTPCYARGVTHRGPYKDGPGAINIPVSVGGQVVNPGDIVVGDENGVVCFAPRFADELLALAAEHAAKEEAIKQQIASGAEDQTWFTHILRQKGLLKSW